MAELTGRALIASRCAKFFKNGDFVNLGIGVPLMCVNYLPDNETSFMFIRGGHIDAAVLGTLQVDQEGSIANWTIPGKLVPGMGGAMDLCAGVKKIIVATDHCEKNGQSKILKKCTLPLTGYQCVTDIVTERCYFEVTPEGLVLREVAPGYTVEDILACTDADVIVPDEVGVMQ